MSEETESYKRLYSESEAMSGGSNPEKVVADILKYRNTGSALDLGAGGGRHSLFLAANGFEVKAIDSSEANIDRLNSSARARGLSIQTEVADVRNLRLDGNFDAVISTFILHKLTREEALILISQMQEHTNKDGLNAVTAFTKSGDLYGADPSADKFYLNEGELRDLYQGWDILEYEEVDGPVRKQKPDGSQMRNARVMLLAKKIY